MKKYNICIFLIALCLFSCMKTHVNKIITDSTSISNILIHEKVDTNITIKSDTVLHYDRLGNFLNGDTITSETSDQKTEVYENGTKIIVKTIIKEKKVPVYIDRTIHKNTTTTIHHKTKIKYSKPAVVSNILIACSIFLIIAILVFIALKLFHIFK